MTELLAPEVVSRRIEALRGWTLSEDGLRIEKSFSFEDFARALAFVNKVGEYAEAQQHHPDIEFGWGKAKITLSTHSAGGITDKDIDLAEKIDAIAL